MTAERKHVEAALERLLRSAYGDTGGSRRTAEFLLSLWNGARYKANLQELLYIDQQYFEDMLTVLQALFLQNAQLDSFLTEEQMKPVVEEWGEEFSAAAS